MLRLLNLTNAPITIHKGTVIATITELLLDKFMTAAQVTNTTHAPSTPKRDLLCIISNVTIHQQFYSLQLFFSDIFPESEDNFGHTPLLQHHIDTGSATNHPDKSLNTNSRRLSSLSSNYLRRMLFHDFKVHGPLLLSLVPKNGSLLFCVDYQIINEVTRKDAYPLPQIDDTLDTLAGSSWFTTQFLSGYWQVDIAESDWDKTAFATREGLFHFNVMPFGLCNAPATFKLIMNMVLAGLLWDVCLYISVMASLWA